MQATSSSPWRPFAFWIAALVAMALCSFAGHLGPDRFYALVWGSTASLAVYALIRWITARAGCSMRSAGLGWNSGTPMRLIAGVALGAVTVAAILATSALLLGSIRFAAVARFDPAALGLALAALAATVVMEELVFRSYALRTSIAAFGLWRGQALVAAAFGALHLLYGWPVMTVLLGVLPSAILFGTAAVVSRGLALPVGVHFGMVAARLVSGETGTPLAFVMDTSSLDPARAATVAPWIGAIVPLAFAAGLYFVRKRGAIVMPD